MLQQRLYSFSSCLYSSARDRRCIAPLCVHARCRPVATPLRRPDRPAASCTQCNISVRPQVHIAGLHEAYRMEPPRDRGQWLVPARKDGLLTIMTPVYPDNETMALLFNQVRLS